MRHILVAAAAILALAATVVAQEPPTPVLEPGQGKAEEILDFYLKKWDERSAKSSGLVASCTLTEIDVLGKHTVYSGDLSILRPKCISLFLKPEADPESTRRWMHLGTDGEQLWIADDSQKVAITRPLPELAREHLLYLLLAAASTAELKKRFDMAVDPDDETRFNKYYMHIVLTPRSKEDREHFKKAELVLWKNEDDDRFKKYFMLPARLWIQKSNGEQSNWEFKGLTPKELTKDDFALPKLAADWKVEAVPDVPSAGKRK